jgi:hypothetical protein
MPEGSEERRQAEEELHDRLWRVMDDSTVREAMGLGTGDNNVGKVTNDLARVISDYGSTRPDLRAQYQQSAAHMQEAVRNGHDLLSLVAAGDQFLGNDAPVKFPSVVSDVQSLVRQRPPPSQQSIRALSNALNDAYEAINNRNGVQDKGKLSADQVHDLKNVMDYLTYAAQTRDLSQSSLQYSSDVLASILTGNGTSDALRGNEALTGPSLESIRSKMIEWAKRSDVGAWDGLVAEAKERLKKAGNSNPSEKQIEDAISLLALNQRIEEKLHGKPELADQFRKDVDKVHNDVLAKTVAKLVKEDKTRLPALEELADKGRRPPCLPCVTMAILAGGTFMAAVLHEFPGPQNADTRKALGTVHCNAAGKADQYCPGWKAPVHDVAPDMAPPSQIAQPATGTDHDGSATADLPGVP